MSSPGMPQPQQSPQSGSPDGKPQEQQSDPLQDFRKLAQDVQGLGTKYPEAAEGAAQMLKLIQGMMTRVAGNPQRTQEKQAPPTM